MELNGKCKEDFLNKHKCNEAWIDIPIFKTALIIEFLETKKYNGISLFSFCFQIYNKHRIGSQSFNDICLQSIKQANEIYNENFK